MKKRTKKSKKSFGAKVRVKATVDVIKLGEVIHSLAEIFLSPGYVQAKGKKSK